MQEGPPVTFTCDTAASRQRMECKPPFGRLISFSRNPSRWPRSSADLDVKERIRINPLRYRTQHKNTTRKSRRYAYWRPRVTNAGPQSRRGPSPKVIGGLAGTRMSFAPFVQRSLDQPIALHGLTLKAPAIGRLRPTPAVSGAARFSSPTYERIAAAAANRKTTSRLANRSSPLPRQRWGVHKVHRTRRRVLRRLKCAIAPAAYHRTARVHPAESRRRQDVSPAKTI
jgi:hypothetical protein